MAAPDYLRTPRRHVEEPCTPSARRNADEERRAIYTKGVKVIDNQDEKEYDRDAWKWVNPLVCLSGPLQLSCVRWLAHRGIGRMDTNIFPSVWLRAPRLLEDNSVFAPTFLADPIVNSGDT